MATNKRGACFSGQQWNFNLSVQQYGGLKMEAQIDVLEISPWRSVLSRNKTLYGKCRSCPYWSERMSERMFSLLPQNPPQYHTCSKNYHTWNYSHILNSKTCLGVINWYCEHWTGQDCWSYIESTPTSDSLLVRTYLLDKLEVSLQY